MTLEQLNALKIGNIIYVSINSGCYGIGKYQYIGVFTCHENADHIINDSAPRKHVFLSEHFVSVVTLLFGKEEQSRKLQNIFLTMEEAIARTKEPSFNY